MVGRRAARARGSRLTVCGSEPDALPGGGSAVLENVRRGSSCSAWGSMPDVAEDLRPPLAPERPELIRSCSLGIRPHLAAWCHRPRSVGADQASSSSGFVVTSRRAGPAQPHRTLDGTAASRSAGSWRARSAPRAPEVAQAIRTCPAVDTRRVVVPQGDHRRPTKASRPRSRWALSVEQLADPIPVDGSHRHLREQRHREPQPCESLVLGQPLPVPEVDLLGDHRDLE